jgi:dinuclear metal center YbgI/SA1388 family protein
MDAKEVAQKLDLIFNKGLASDWDNCGLLVDPGIKEVRTIMTCIDACKDVLEQAIKNQVDLLVCHHPFIFEPVKSIVSTSMMGEKIIQAIKNDIGIYCAHTNYDLMTGGLADYIMERLGVTESKPVMPVFKNWFKFVVFVPEPDAEKIREVICSHHAGIIGNYTCCTFSTRGKGTFMPLSGAKPFIGEEDKLSIVDEVKIESIVDEDNLSCLVNAVREAHPYEEAAYDVYKVENSCKDIGFGRIGELHKEMTFREMDHLLKNVFKIKNLRFITGKNQETENKTFKKIAFINGSANSLTSMVRNEKIDALIVGEIGYHHAIEIAEKGNMVIEIGHLESEKLAIGHMHDKIREMFEEIGKKINLLKADSGILGWRYSIE